jgi:hypothetical protein
MDTQTKTAVVKARKSIAHGSSIVIEIQPDNTVKWRLEGGWMVKVREPKVARIEYDYDSLDSNLEPKEFFKTDVSTYYLEDFTLV